jgi:hypothetical protein
VIASLSGILRMLQSGTGKKQIHEILEKKRKSRNQLYRIAANTVEPR